MILLRKTNQTWRHYRGSLINENKWRSTKDGVKANLIDFGSNSERPYRDLMVEMIDFIKETVDIFDTHEYINNILNIIDNGTSADRQIDIYRNAGDHKAVVDHLIAETAERL